MSFGNYKGNDFGLNFGFGVHVVLRYDCDSVTFLHQTPTVDWSMIR